MTHKIAKDSIVPISITLLLSLVCGVWFLAVQISGYTNRLINLETAVEKATGYRWSFLMERESWIEFKRVNPTSETPDVQKIRDAHQVR